MKQITNVLAWAKTRPPSITESGTSSYDSASMVGDPEVDMEDKNPPVYVLNALGRIRSVFICGKFGRIRPYIHGSRFYS